MVTRDFTLSHGMPHIIQYQPVESVARLADVTKNFMTIQDLAETSTHALGTLHVPREDGTGYDKVVGELTMMNRIPVISHVDGSSAEIKDPNGLVYFTQANNFYPDIEDVNFKITIPESLDEKERDAWVRSEITDIVRGSLNLTNNDAFSCVLKAQFMSSGKYRSVKGEAADQSLGDVVGRQTEMDIDPNTTCEMFGLYSPASISSIDTFEGLHLHGDGHVLKMGSLEGTMSAMKIDTEKWFVFDTEKGLYRKVLMKDENPDSNDQTWYTPETLPRRVLDFGDYSNG